MHFGNSCSYSYDKARIRSRLFWKRLPSTPWVSNYVARFYPRAGFRFTEKEGSEDTQSEEGSKLRMLRLKAKLLHLEEKTAVRGEQSASVAAL